MLALLHRHRIEKLLVVNRANELVGMITVKDFQKATEFPRASKDDTGRLRVGAAVGTTPDTLERVAALREAGVDLVVVDTAHGHSKGVIDTVRRIKAKWSDAQVIAGNIATAGGRARARRCRRGRGQGRHRTRLDLHHAHRRRRRRAADLRGRQRRRIAARHRRAVISDGGIRFSGDIAKALAAGAHAVMIGGLFAGTEESPGRGRALPGRLLQVLSRHGLARGHGRAAGLRRPLLPGRRHRA